MAFKEVKWVGVHRRAAYWKGFHYHINTPALNIKAWGRHHSNFSQIIVHRFAIDEHTDPDRLFHIDPRNGSITTLKSLDREVSKWHNISVLASEISKTTLGKRENIYIVSSCFFFPHNLDSVAIFSDNPRQRSRVPVLIKVLDVNDNAPEFAMFYETFVCENVRAGQVSAILFLLNAFLHFCYRGPNTL